jgi:hypothetical protein
MLADRKHKHVGKTFGKLPPGRETQTMDTMKMDLRDRGYTNEDLNHIKLHSIPPVSYISTATLET